MAENKKSFLFYTDWLHTFEKLEDEEAGKLVKHLLRYVNDREPTAPDRITDIIFEPIKQQLKRDLTKWDSIKERRSEAGKASALSKAKKKSTKSTSVESVEQNQQSSTKSTVNDNVNVNVNVLSKDNEIRPLADIEKLFFEDFEIHRMAFQENEFTVKQLEQAKNEFWNAKKLDAETCAKPYSDTKKHFLNWSRKNKERIKSTKNGTTEKKHGRVTESGLQNFLNRSDSTSPQ